MYIPELIFLEISETFKIGRCWMMRRQIMFPFV